jgi:hypothetical protein
LPQHTSCLLVIRNSNAKFPHRKNIHNLFASKKRKLYVEQNFQRILAQEAAASTNENRDNNKFPPDEPMVESHDADEPMSERAYQHSNEGAADDPLSDGEASFAPSSDDSMSSEDDCDQYNFTFDDIFGLEMTDDGTTDGGQSLEMAPPDSRHGADDVIDGTPRTMMYQDEEEKPPTAKDDVEFTDLEVAELEFLVLCDGSGALCGFFDDALTFLRQCSRKGIDITKAKGHALFVATVQLKVKCLKPVSKKVAGHDVIYFPFFDSLQDLLRSSAFYDLTTCVQTKKSKSVLIISSQ